MSSSSRVDMATMLSHCHAHEWRRVTECVRQNPSLALMILKMKNKLTTTILHQAISSRGNVAARADTIMTILKVQPHAASLSNGYNSLPLHVIAQRNTSIDAPTKERLIVALVNTYPEALEKKGGLRERTPLHIAFTDYISPRIIKLMVGLCPDAVFMTDKQGWLPIHVACSRHCSPEKLDLLLEVNPACLEVHTKKGQTPLSLAQSTATKAHPNLLLLQDIKNRLGGDADMSVMTRAPTPVSPTINKENLQMNSKARKKRASKRRTAPGPNDDAELLLHFHKNVAAKSQLSSFDYFPSTAHDDSDLLHKVTAYPV